jgi:hypothetical protein
MSFEKDRDVEIMSLRISLIDYRMFLDRVIELLFAGLKIYSPAPEWKYLSEKAGRKLPLIALLKILMYAWNVAWLRFCCRNCHATRIRQPFATIFLLDWGVLNDRLFKSSRA